MTQVRRYARSCATLTRVCLLLCAFGMAAAGQDALPSAPSFYRQLWPLLAADSTEGFSADILLPTWFADYNIPVAPLVGGANNGDTLIERYRGPRFGYADARSRRRMLSVLYSRYRTGWSPQTLSAAKDSGFPGLYRLRNSFQATLTSMGGAASEVWSRKDTNWSGFYAGGGASLSTMEMESPTQERKSARAVIGSFGYKQQLKQGRAIQWIETEYEGRVSVPRFSDFNYTRHLWDGRYRYQRGEDILSVDLTLGRITGNAPMFELFSLGNTRTLKGWNKLDVAPLGGSRSAYSSVEYHHRGIGGFYDIGAVWESRHWNTATDGPRLTFAVHGVLRRHYSRFRNSFAKEGSSLARFQPDALPTKGTLTNSGPQDIRSTSL
jgi:hypothetical protein